MIGQVRIDHINRLKGNMVGQQLLFKVPKENAETATKFSF